MMATSKPEKLNINEYEVLAKETLAPNQKVDYSGDFGNAKQVLLEMMVLVSAGHTADAIKRSLFYSDKKIGERLLKAKAEMQVSHDKINDFTLAGAIPQDKVDLLHAAVGIMSEAGEVVNEIINSILDSREVNKINLREEGGDVMWYTNVLLTDPAVGSGFEEAAHFNITKLKKRYPNKFNSFDAINRDLDEEQRALTSSAAE